MVGQASALPCSAVQAFSRPSAVGPASIGDAESPGDHLQLLRSSLPGRMIGLVHVFTLSACIRLVELHILVRTTSRFMPGSPHCRW